MILGRTHREVPSVWYRPVWSGDSHIIVDQVPSGSTLDISSQPALWGGLFRLGSYSYLTRSSLDVEAAMNEKHSAELLEAHLIETLSSIGAPSIDYYALRVRGKWSESTLSGALATLENARQDEMIRHFGLCVEGPSHQAAAMWQFHDAFDFLICQPEDLGVLAPIAIARRVGIVVETQAETPHVQLRTVGNEGGKP